MTNQDFKNTTFIETTGEPWRRIYFSLEHFKNDYYKLFKRYKLDYFREMDEVIFADEMLKHYSACLKTENEHLKVFSNENTQLNDIIKLNLKSILRHIALKKSMLSHGIMNGFIEKNDSELKQKVNSLQQNIYSEAIKSIPQPIQRHDIKEVIQNKNTQNLGLPEIALKYVYEGLTITQKNGNNIAYKYGWKSGGRLYQWFTYYTKHVNRKGDPGTRIKLLNKINRFETVIELLPESKRFRAIDEVTILKNILEKEY